MAKSKSLLEVRSASQARDLLAKLEMSEVSGLGTGWALIRDRA